MNVISFQSVHFKNAITKKNLSHLGYHQENTLAYWVGAGMKTEILHKRKLTFDMFCDNAKVKVTIKKNGI